MSAAVRTNRRTIRGNYPESRQRRGQEHPTFTPQIKEFQTLPSDTGNISKRRMPLVFRIEQTSVLPNGTRAYSQKSIRFSPSAFYAGKLIEEKDPPETYFPNDTDYWKERMVDVAKHTNIEDELVLDTCLVTCDNELSAEVRSSETGEVYRLAAKAMVVKSLEGIEKHEVTCSCEDLRFSKVSYKEENPQHVCKHYAAVLIKVERREGRGLRWHTTGEPVIPFKFSDDIMREYIVMKYGRKKEGGQKTNFEIDRFFLQPGKISQVLKQEYLEPSDNGRIRFEVTKGGELLETYDMENTARVSTILSTYGFNWTGNCMQEAYLLRDTGTRIGTGSRFTQDTKMDTAWNNTNFDPLEILDMDVPFMEARIIERPHRRGIRVYDHERYVDGQRTYYIPEVHLVRPINDEQKEIIKRNMEKISRERRGESPETLAAIQWGYNILYIPEIVQYRYDITHRQYVAHYLIEAPPVDFGLEEYYIEKLDKAFRNLKDQSISDLDEESELNTP